jgi:hypothetical protein
MVLFEVDAARFAIVEFERYAPWSIDMDRIALGVESLQGVKVKTRNVHFLGPDGDVETIESGEDALVHFRVDLRTPAPRP